ncbi:MAG: nucleotidyltransferase domain-containing protein [Acidobacteria bacterium]|nr:nucleotidyltransferase domain-containing protein [Acidobacteriota bacterium]
MSTDTDRLIVDELRAAPGDLIAVYRFGSTAHGTTHPGSDTDVAVLMRQRLSPESRFDLQERIAARLGHDVDLVDLAAATPVMAIQVVAGGALLYEADSTARGLFEDRVFGAYARLNEERRGILERIAAEGTVYGR